ncbi:MAG TPA: hypothetical protein VNA13_03105 [Xanthomonadales bacterium]|nr:hypothetical protein [Xanthomonadales bacterium]
MSLLERLDSHEMPVTDLATDEKRPGTDGAMYLHHAITKFPDSLTARAAYVSLNCKTAGYQPDELGRLVAGDITHLIDVKEWTNALRRVPPVDEASVATAANAIFPFAQRMSVLSEQQLRGVTAGYPKNSGPNNGLVTESEVRRDANIMILNATRDRSLGHITPQISQSPGRPTERNIFTSKIRS